MKKSIIANASCAAWGALVTTGGLFGLTCFPGFANVASAAEVELYGYVDLGLSYTHTSVDAESAAARAADTSSEGALSVRSNVNMNPAGFPRIHAGEECGDPRALEISSIKFHP